MYTIKADELLIIAIAAKEHLLRLNEMYEKEHINMHFNKELEAAKKLRKWLIKTNWDEDTELMIDEMPF